VREEKEEMRRLLEEERRGREKDKEEAGLDWLYS